MSQQVLDFTQNFTNDLLPFVYFLAKWADLIPIWRFLAKNRAVSREIPTGNSREFPEKSCSRKFPGIISGSREFSGIFYVLRRGNVLNFTIFQMFFFWFRSSFTVEKNTIHAENHWNSSMNCIFLRIGVFLSFYKVSFKVPGNSREFPDWFREIPVPGNENLSGNRPP